MRKINFRVIFLFIGAVAFLSGGLVIAALTTIPSVQVVSTASDETQSNGVSKNSSVSVNGQKVAFNSDATNLVTNVDGNGTKDVFVKDTVTGVTTLVSVDVDGEAGNGASDMPSISADGNHVGFESAASDLVADDDNEYKDVFVRNTMTNTTTLVSSDSDGNIGDGDSKNPSVSGNGQKVAFDSAAENLHEDDDNGYKDVFVKDTVTGQTTLVSVNADGNNGGDDNSDAPSISQDGGYVAFQSSATDLVEYLDGDGYTSGKHVFLRNLAAGTTTRVSVDPYGYGGDGESSEPSVSANGRYVAFLSSATNLVAGVVDDDDGQKDVFVRDMEAKTTTKVSVNSDGVAATAKSAAPIGISSDGRYVVFTCDAYDLGAQTAVGKDPTYVRDRTIGTTTLVSVTTAGVPFTGQADKPQISPDGRYVSHHAKADEIDSDINVEEDVYLHNVLDQNGDGVRDDQEIRGVTNTDTNKTFYYYNWQSVMNVSTTDSAVDLISYVESFDPTLAMQDTRGFVPAEIPPQGLVSFTLNVEQGATVSVTITFPLPVDVQSSYFKYSGLTGWTDFSDNALISGNKVTLTLTDGGAGDADGVANGVIVDPSGPGTPFAAYLTSANATISDVTYPDTPAGAPADFTPETVVSFTATGFPGTTADISITFVSLPANPVIYKVVNGTWKQIYPTNETDGITNVALNGNTLSYTIEDGSDCDIDGLVNGSIQDPVVSGSTAAVVPPGATPTPPIAAEGQGGCFISTLAN